MTADCIRHSVLDTYCEIYFSFSFSAENGRFSSFSFIFRPKRENLFFGYFYFTAEKVPFIFGRPLTIIDVELLACGYSGVVSAIPASVRPDQLQFLATPIHVWSFSASPGLYL